MDDDDDPDGYRKMNHYNHDSLNKLSQSYLEVLQNLGRILPVRAFSKHRTCCKKQCSSSPRLSPVM